jgi:hypothetical protein
LARMLTKMQSKTPDQYNSDEMWPDLCIDEI